MNLFLFLFLLFNFIKITENIQNKTTYKPKYQVAKDPPKNISFYWEEKKIFFNYQIISRDFDHNIPVVQTQNSYWHHKTQPFVVYHEKDQNSFLYLYANRMYKDHISTKKYFGLINLENHNNTLTPWNGTLKSECSEVIIENGKYEICRKKTLKDLLNYGDFILYMVFEFPSPPSRRENGSKNLIFEILVVIDNSIYEEMFYLSGNVSRYITGNLLLYYFQTIEKVSVFFSSLDSNVSVRLAGIYVFENNYFSIFNKSRKVNLTESDLETFGIWLQSMSNHLPYHDSAVLFTKDYSSNISGIGYKGGICQNHKGSIVRESGMWRDAKIISKILNENLGNQTNEVEKIFEYEEPKKDLINKFNFHKKKNNCLKRQNKYPSEENLKKYKLSLGQRFKPTIQCKFFYGEKSYFLSLGRKSIKTICQNLNCYNPESKKFEKFPTMDGTPCDHHKWCQDGKCIGGKNLPILPKICIFGDLVGNIIFNKDNKKIITTCENLEKNKLQTQCLVPDINDTCCKTCQNLKEKNPRCPFGDLNPNCKEDSLSCYIPDKKINCCKFCEGTPEIAGSIFFS